MEQFASRYCECNTEVFPSTGNHGQFWMLTVLDTAYVLAFSLIMLNTDAHNPAIKHKMSLQDFQNNNRGIADGKDLPANFLEKLYNNIKQNEIKINGDSLFSQASKKGWLRKLSRNNYWQKRWFVISNNCLFYFYSAEVC